MAAKTQDVGGYYVWEVPGKPVAVHLHLEAVDWLLADVMRGFGVVPKRGAEVGGILIGAIERGDPTIVRVEDFEAVLCNYKRGPSYVFTDEDRSEFEQACERWQPKAGNRAYAVGYFRSHTRDGLSLGPEDLELLNRHFPDPAHIALLIKPFATKVSVAGFFFRENGTFQVATPLEFPFLQRELIGREPPLPRPPKDNRPRGRDLPAEDQPDNAGGAPPETGPGYDDRPLAKPRFRIGWVWLPLSFVFLLLGVLLGWALSLGPQAPSSETQNISLGLAVTKADDNLNVTWNRHSPLIRAAQSGVLEIEDGNLPPKPVELDPAQLQNGSIIYRNSANAVRFKLIIYPSARVSLTETLEWKR